MTACVKETEKKMEGGALSNKVIRAVMAAILAIGLMPAMAFADEAVAPAAVDTATNQEAWDNATYVYSAEKDAYGNYSVTEGDAFSVKSITTVGGVELGAGDYTVLYFTDNGTAGKLDGADAIIACGKSIDGRIGGAPAEAGTAYIMAVIQGELNFETGKALENTDTWETLVTDSTAPKVTGPVIAHGQAFSVKTAAKSLDGVYAFNGTTDKDLAKTSFAYTGNDLELSFAVGNTVLNAGEFSITWTTKPAGAKIKDLAGSSVTIEAAPAGEYKGTIVGTSGKNMPYAGAEAEVSFTVAKLDLSTVKVTAEDGEADKTSTPSSKPNYKVENFSVSGVALAPGADVDVAAGIYTDPTGAKTADFKNMAAAGSYTFQLAAKPNQANVTGSCTVEVGVFTDKTADTDFLYADKAIHKKDASDNLESFRTFVPSIGDSFNPALLNIATSYTGFTYTVTKDGVEVSTYDEPGVYTVTMVQDRKLDYSKGGSTTGIFTVQKSRTDYSSAVVFVSVDGKNVASGATLPYTGAAYEPVVVAKTAASGGTLIPSADYTVEIKNAEGETVEAIDMVGKYTLTVKFSDAAESSKDVVINVAKAKLVSIKAAADFFPLPADGSAVVPTFAGYTKADFKGIRFDLAADEISAVYYNTDDAGAKTTKVSAADLTEAGKYIAEINVLTSAELVQGSNLSATFTISESVAFADVDAAKWYADPIYKARENKYINGIAGTNLFLPEASITRAEISGIMFNMAGADEESIDPSKYPNKFTDVDSDAWFAKTVSYVSRAGIINGYSNTTLFGPFDNATREQVAAIFYNYAKSMGKDVSVDADAVLAGFADGSQVSSWARTAVAWAADNGIMGNGGSLSPLASITRAEVAAMAVNFQPKPLS